MALLAGAAALAFGSAQAATVNYTSAGTCSVSDFTPAADNCFGTVLPEPVNNGTDPDADTPPPVAALNADTYAGTLGLFGKTDWQYVGDITATLNGTGGGTFSIAADLSGFDYVTYVLKQGPTFAAYYFDTAPLSGSFSLAAFGPNTTGLSHFSVYGGGTPAPIPLPATGLLLVGGLAGLAALRRKRTA